MDPLTMSVSRTARRMGYNRSAVSVLCDRGEILCAPSIRPDGTRSRTHRRVIWESAKKWLDKNTLRSADDFKHAVDGRRNR